MMRLPFRPLGSILVCFSLTSCQYFQRPADPAAAGAYGDTAASAYNGYAAAPQPQSYPSYQQPSPGTYAAPDYSQPAYGQNNSATGAPESTDASSGSSTRPSGGSREHVVASGENLTKISRRYGVTVDSIVRANNLTSPDQIRSGQRLAIP